MDLFVALWLPMLLSAVFVFIVSSILHMVIPIHRGDYQKLENEAQLLEQMRAQGIQPGEYMFPCPASMKDMSSPEMIEKYVQGPVGFLTIVPSGKPGMGKNLVQWFFFSLLVAIFTGYVASLGLGRGADSMIVFRLSSSVAILGYGASYLSDSIWKGRRWGVTLKFVFDGVIYGLVTAATFVWLWPGLV